jgi:hypothetical protein
MRALARDTSGGIVPFLGAAVPVLAVLLVGASELALVSADKSKLQDVADAVAMDASQELAFSVDQSVVERAKANAAQQLAKLKGDRPQGTIVVTPTIQFDAKGDPEGMHVAITATRKSFFGNMLPPGGFVTNVETTALRMGKAPLCVLGTSRTLADTVNTTQSALVDAGKCLVHSNNTMNGASAAGITSAAAEAVTRATGKIVPTALVGAEPIADPFATINLWSPPTTCEDVHLKAADGWTEVKPGLHCKKVLAAKGERVRFLDGEHYFAKGGIDVKEAAQISGKNVVLIYDKDSIFDVGSAALVDLSGRQTGHLAGFVLVATRDNANGFTVNAGNILNLHGVVYVPGAALTVLGTGKMAEKSDWTVVVAQKVGVTGTAALHINAKYRGSPVPVPKGVGNKAVDKTKNARLKR